MVSLKTETCMRRNGKNIVQLFVFISVLFKKQVFICLLLSV